MIKNKLFLTLFSILITIIGTYYAEGSFAAQPHGDEHLHKYAEKLEFDASVPLGDGCSASRIKIGEDDPIDFYATAAHCFGKHEDFTASPAYQMLIESLKEIERVSKTIPSSEVNIKEIIEKHLSPLSDDEINSQIGTSSKNELILEVEQQLKKTSISKLLSTLLSESTKKEENIQPEKVDYIRHPKIDLAIFTTNQQSNQLKYPLYKGDLNDLIDTTVTNVAFGASMLSGEEDDESKKRQAFDATIEFIIGNELYSAMFKPDANRTLEDTPVGAITGGDSGGTLLIKEKDGYKFLGAVGGFGNHPKKDYGAFSSSLSSLLSLYEEIPESLKDNLHNQYCIQKLLQDPELKSLGKPCYGVFNRWTGIDLKFVEKAKKDLLAKKPVYAYPPATKTSDLSIAFSLKNGLNENHLEQKEGLIGYNSQYAKLVVNMDGGEITIPFQCGSHRIIYQLAGKQYPIEVTIEEAIDGKAFFVKANMMNEGKDQSAVHNLNDELAIDKREKCNPIFSFAKPVYYTLYPYTTHELPLEISLDKCLSNNNFIDTDLLKGKEILGYVGDSYDVVINLNGQEIKRFNNKELTWEDTDFSCQYSEKNYSVKVKRFEEAQKESIYLTITQVANDKADNSIESILDSNENEDSKFIRTPVRYFFTDSSKVIAQDLGITVDLMDAIAKSAEDDQIGFKSIGYGNPNSVARILLMGHELTRFELKNLYTTLKTSQVGKNGESYSITIFVSFNKGASCYISLDIQEIEKDEL